MKLKGPDLYRLILIIITIIKLGDATVRASQAVNCSTIIIKSIKCEDGDVIDCVHISHQPALDHPLLKGHTIKMTPSDHPAGGLFRPKNLSNDIKSNGEKNEIIQLWQLSGECPEGTIPIRRTDKLKNPKITKKPTNIFPRPSSLPATNAAVDLSQHEYAIASTGVGNYYGAKATISAWNPYVERPLEFSLSQLWVVGGSGSNLNTIEVGWTVDPAVFGDYRTRLFVFWTRDNYRSTGCYNLRCSGFVQITNRMVIGGSIATTPRNPPEVTLLVWKDARQRVWWLQYNGIVVGYWPASIFTALKGSASMVQWGGEIINLKVGGRHTATQMGSGRFAEAGSGRASYFRNLQVVNNRNTLIPPPTIGSFASRPRCYDVAVRRSNNPNWGIYFYYGGPGRNRHCL